MLFKETVLQGAFIIEVDPRRDDRGFYARTWCRREFEAHGLQSNFVQGGFSFSGKKGTLRGMHYQIAPHGQPKLVRCGKGSIYDVILDLRPESATFKKWFAIELTEHNHRMIYVPEGLAHGFQTLEDNTEVCYQMAGFHDSAAERGISWNDPAFNIAWPPDNRIMSERDRNFKGFVE